MTKQCFWFNNSYVKSIVSEKDIYADAYSNDSRMSKVAEDVPTYQFNKKDELK